MKWNTKLAGLMAALSFGAEVEQTVQSINLIPLFHLLLPDCWAVHCLLCLLTSACTVWTPGPLALCSFFFFFNSVVLFWQLTCCWPLLCLDDQVHSTFLLTRRPSPECRAGSRTVALQRRRWSRNVHYVQVVQCSPVWAALPYLS